MVSARSATILDRFPACLEVADPDKGVAFVVDRLATELDIASSTTGRIRRNHRLGEVDNEWDLQNLVDLHGFGPLVFAPLVRRLAALGSAGRALVAAPEDVAAASDVRAALSDLVGLPADVFPSFPGEQPTLSEQRLGSALLRATSYVSEMARRRELVREAIDVHAEGNATVAALLRATAAFLALRIAEPLQHYDDGYWHFAICDDRLTLTEPPSAETAENELMAFPDLVALEENPFQPADVQPSPKWSRQQFAITRAGWEEVPVTIRVVGIAERCLAPMVVNVDTGRGVVYTDLVPDGAELRFERSGQILLDDADVGGRGFSFSGGLFADDPAHPNAFVWCDADDADVGGDRRASFAMTSPLAGGFDRRAVFPHGGGLLTAPTLLPATTRWAFFVREAHFGRDTVTDPETAVATYFSGVFDESVFDPTDDDGQRDASAEIGLDWEEREAFAVNVWIPRRFEVLDSEGLVAVREQIRVLLDRYRAAGVHVRVKYADDRWTLGTGIVRPSDSLEPLGTIVAGTAMWPDPTEQPD